MPDRRLLQRIFIGPEHSVASFSVQAQTAGPPAETPSAYRVLVRHLFISFFVSDSPEADVHAAARMLQLAAIAALPPFLLTLALMPFYNGLSPFGQLRAYPLTVRDHFLYIAYALALSSLVALLKWESFFPTVLDVRVLGLLPIPGRRLFLAKVHSAVWFFALFVVGANLPAALFLPGMAAAPSLPRHLAAHLVAVVAAGTFATALPLSLLSAAELLRNPRLRSLLSASIQAIWIGSSLVTLFLSPVLAAITEHAIPLRRALLLPPLWFCGLYEAIQDASPQASRFHSLADLALAATALSVALLLLLYPLAYHRIMQRAIAAEGAHAKSNHSLSRWHQRLLRPMFASPQHQAGFHFATQTLFRVPRLRLYLVLSASIGTGLAGSWIAIAHGRSLAAFETPAAVLFAAVTIVLAIAIGVITAYNAAHEQSASWLFTAVHEGVRQDFLSGVFTALRIGLLGAGTMLLLAGTVLANLNASSHSSIALAYVPHGAVALASMLLREGVILTAIVFLITDVLALTFRDVPFTEARLRNTDALLILLGTVAVFTPLLLMTVWRFCNNHLQSWPITLLWPALAAAIWFSTRHWNQQLNFKQWLTTEDGETVQQLHLS